MTWPTYVESELQRAVTMTAKDRIQRWVTMDGKIHTEPVPYRDAISVRWLPIAECVVYNYRHRAIAHDAIALTMW